MTINVLGLAQKKYKNLVKWVAEKTIEYLGYNDLELTIKFVSKTQIKKLNNNFRNIDRVTDVLSFPATECKIGDKLPEGEYLGDMALCLGKAKMQGKEYGNGTIKELSKLVVHSILHMVGYDHIEDKDYLIMQQQENKIEEYLEGKGENYGV